MAMFKIASAAAGLVLFGGLVMQPYRPVIVRGVSMAPTYSDGQLVFSVPVERKLRVGDVVLLEKDGATLIKRISKVPGDHVEELYVKLAHKWVPATTEAAKRQVREGRSAGRVAVIPEGEIYVLGDNAELSLDSRIFGLVPISSVRGLIVSSTRA